MSQQNIEAWIIETWRDLGLRVQDRSSDFFASGGTSLAAARFIATVDEIYGEDSLAPEVLYETPTVTSVARVIVANTALVTATAS